LVEEHYGEVKSGYTEGHKKEILYALERIMLLPSHLTVMITETPVRILNDHTAGNYLHYRWCTIRENLIFA
jgi:hypothetical protein